MVVLSMLLVVNFKFGLELPYFKYEVYEYACKI